MISGEEHLLLAENLSETYLAIARGVPYTKIQEGEGWIMATNQFEHPICNFAICEDGKAINTEEIRRHALGRQFFNLYVSHRGADERPSSLSSNEGLVKLYSLVQMVETGKDDGSAGALRECLSPEDRRTVSEFMSRQFFGSQSPAVREKICFATLSAPELRLYELRDSLVRNRPLAAVMLHRTRGVVGLYNLCVSPPFRSKGYGAATVSAVKLIAAQENVILGLQCDPSLSPWYSRLGLAPVGRIDVYGFKKPLSYNGR